MSEFRAFSRPIKSEPGVVRDYHAKICCQCNRANVRENYHNKTKFDRQQTYRDKYLTAKFGMSEQDYLNMLESQRGGCAICGSSEVTATTYNLSVDHDRLSMAVRGLLCHSCNAGLGYFKDNIAFLRSAAIYLDDSNNYFSGFRRTHKYYDESKHKAKLKFKEQVDNGTFNEMYVDQNVVVALPTNQAKRLLEIIEKYGDLTEHSMDRLLYLNLSEALAYPT